MNSLVRKFMVAAVMSLLITNIMPAQRTSQPGVSRPAQVGPVGSVPAAPAGERGSMAPNNEMMDEYEMMMEMEEPYNLSRSLPMTGRRVFIVPTAEIEIEDYVEIERDMEVMSLIYDRALKKPQMIGGVFTVLEDFFGRNSHVTEAIYLDGYGALFFMEVNFALFGSSQSKQKEAPKEAEERVDQIWKRAEQELYSPQELNRNRGSGSSREYDPEKVENLKATLITVLKHAANIKALKSDELVVLTILGKATRPSRAIVGRSGRRNLRTTKSVRAKTIHYVGTVVNIRAKKADIDAYSKGELDFDRFHERIQIFTHWK
jgi:hypothetical protein